MLPEYPTRAPACAANSAGSSKPSPRRTNTPEDRQHLRRQTILFLRNDQHLDRQTAPASASG